MSVMFMVAMFAWIILAIGTQVFVTLNYPYRVGRGRYLSRPLARLPLRWCKWPHVRPFQIGLMLPVAVVLSESFPLVTAAPLCLTTVALYLDDYLTGDDESWRRFWEAVRNKIDWKMDLPEPVVERGRS